LTVRRLAAFVVLLLAAACSEPARTVAVVPPPVHHATPPDWFQQHLAAARQARLAHEPKDDAAGAQADYDRVVRAACVRVALSGPQKYQARCSTILQQTAPPAAAAPDLFSCDPAGADPASADPSALKACND
jgi:hypothetical protein